MNSTAIAERSSSIATAGAVRVRRHRKYGSSTSWEPVPWHTVSLEAEQAASRLVACIARPPAYVWALLGVAIVAHAAMVWYFNQHARSTPAARKHEVQLEIVVAKPPEPKQVEPPKPPPSKPQVSKPAQVLPPIQQAEPQPNAASSES